MSSSLKLKTIQGVFWSLLERFGHSQMRNFVKEVL